MSEQDKLDRIAIELIMEKLRSKYPTFEDFNKAKENKTTEKFIEELKEVAEKEDA